MVYIELFELLILHILNRYTSQKHHFYTFHLRTSTICMFINKSILEINSILNNYVKLLVILKYYVKIIKYSIFFNKFWSYIMIVFILLWTIAVICFF